MSDSESGDLTTSAIISPFRYKFSMSTVAPDSHTESYHSMQATLANSLEISVGGEGIIGRRVTIWAQNSTVPFAEGIIGFN